MLHAVLLDVDGTLLDTREFIFRAFEYAAATEGAQLPARDELATWVGRPLEQIYSQFGAPERAAALVEAHRVFQGANLDLVRPFPGAAETLAALFDHGLRLAAVTSRSRRTSLRSLEVAGLARYLAAVVSAEDHPALKPDPGPLRLALDLITAAPEHAAMVGDTEHDVGAGKALGMRTVAVTYGFHGTAVLEAGPDAAINDIRELPAALGLP